MGKVITGISVSLDGYVNDRAGSVGPLYPDFETFQQSEDLQQQIRRTGAVVMGKHTFQMSDPDWYAGNWEFQVPVFVLVHTAPAKHPREGNGLTFTFVTDGITSAIRQAKAAAGEKDVQVIGGASTIQQTLRAGLADELELDLMPVLLGGGTRLFENTVAEPVLLERLRVVELPEGRTRVSYRVVK